MSEIFLQRGLKGLEACDDIGVDTLRRIKQGEVVKVEITKPRNISFHRKFFALLNVVWQASGDWSSPYALLIELKVNLGHIQKATIRETGEIVSVPKSISFAAMDDFEFEAFYERAIQKLCEMAGGIDPAHLRQAVLDELAQA